mmetsp:Transcript_62693/g.180345  ORF Transcript_62693/g.180345 Transcript_62693/m.180345 type:complete len:356 (-) Transcript_62693:1054-2121(-)
MLLEEILQVLMGLVDVAVALLLLLPELVQFRLRVHYCLLRSVEQHLRRRSGGVLSGEVHLQIAKRQMALVGLEEAPHQRLAPPRRHLCVVLPLLFRNGCLENLLFSGYQQGPLEVLKPHLCVLEGRLGLGLGDLRILHLLHAHLRLVHNNLHLGASLEAFLQSHVGLPAGSRPSSGRVCGGCGGLDPHGANCFNVGPVSRKHLAGLGQPAPRDLTHRELVCDVDVRSLGLLGALAQGDSRILQSLDRSCASGFRRGSGRQRRKVLLLAVSMLAHSVIHECVDEAEQLPPLEVGLEVGLVGFARRAELGHVHGLGAHRRRRKGAVRLLHPGLRLRDGGVQGHERRLRSSEVLLAPL